MGSDGHHAPVRRQPGGARGGHLPRVSEMDANVLLSVPSVRPAARRRRRPPDVAVSFFCRDDGGAGGGALFLAAQGALGRLQGPAPKTPASPTSTNTYGTARRQGRCPAPASVVLTFPIAAVFNKVGHPAVWVLAMGVCEVLVPVSMLCA